MKFLKRYSALKYLLVCLLAIMAYKADVCFCDHSSEEPQLAYELAVLDAAADGGFSIFTPCQECNVPRQTRLANALRTSLHSGRIVSANPLRSCAATVKGETISHCHTLLQQISIGKSLFITMESRHRFISLGKLII